MQRVASGAYTSRRGLPTWPHQTLTMAGTGSCTCHLAWRCPRMSFRCTWTMQWTISPASLPFMMIYAYMDIPLRIMTDTCFSLWRWTANMASFSTVQSAGLGNHKFTSMVQSSPLKACGQIPPKPKPVKTSDSQFLCKASILFGTYKLPSAFHPIVI